MQNEIEPEVIEETDSIFPRESITFILGDDRNTENAFYTEAANYFQYSETAKTDYVVKWCRSLLEVREYLVQNPPSNALPWGTIHLVSHGNQWIGLSVEVIPESRRASTAEIIKYLDNDTFIGIPDHIIDHNSEIEIHACGVGNNIEFVQIMTEVFRSEHAVPVVRASRLFEYYTSVKNSGMIMESEHYFAKAWFTNYMRGYPPSDEIIYSNLKKKYPESSIDWQDALSREEPRWIGDVYHVTFDVPVKWVITYPNEDSLPDVSTLKKQKEWIYSRHEIMDALHKIEIPVEDFNWWFRKVYVNNNDGTRSPAIWVKGYSTILSVLKPLLNDKSEDNLLARKPFIPDLDDGDYYYSYGGVSMNQKLQASSFK
ncbi:hypothetical protein ACFL6I_25900 [candidate division KSB1 bacterium]